MLRKLGIHWESFYLLRYELNEQEVRDKMKLFDYTDVRTLTLDDLRASSQFNATKLELFKKRFDSGTYSCYGVFSDDQLVYSTWISWEQMNYPTFFRETGKLEKNEALLEDSFCLPSFRGKGLHSKMNMYRLSKMIERGKSWALALVLKENKPALRVQLKSNFTFYKRISYIRIFGLRKILIRDCNGSKK